MIFHSVITNSTTEAMDLVQKTHAEMCVSCKTSLCKYKLHANNCPQLINCRNASLIAEIFEFIFNDRALSSITVHRGMIYGQHGSLQDHFRYLCTFLNRHVTNILFSEKHKQAFCTLQPLFSTEPPSH